MSDAIALYTQAMEAKSKGDLQTAFNLLQQCVQISPNEVSYRLHLALVCYEMSKSSEVLREMACFNLNELVKIAPGFVSNWIALAEISLNCNKVNESIAAYEKAVIMEPNNAKTWSTLGFAYTKVGNAKDAKRCFERALSLDPELGIAHFLMTTVLVDDLVDNHKKAFHGERGFQCEKPASYAVESCWNSALGYLNIGDYEKGWNYFEARLRRNTSNHGQILPQDRFTKPLWKRQKDCRVLISHEMGFGDCFLMMRYLPIIKEQFNVDVQFECMPNVIELAQYNLPGIQCLLYGQADEASFDYHLPMMSLPLACGTTRETIPWDGPYIKALPTKIEEFRQKLNLKIDQLNIGICWCAGIRNFNATNYADGIRKSLAFDDIKPLLDTGVHFVSLQPESDELPNPGIKDFSDTAAIIELMDGIISVDTSVANLAGSMGKKTWVMNRVDSCWRYSKDIETPWYPTVIDVRQNKTHEWFPVVTKLAFELERFAREVHG